VSEYVWMADRYAPAEMEPDHRGIVMWGVADSTAGGAWVRGLLDEAGNEGPLPFPTKDSAISWIRSVRYRTEANGGLL
jgi:hypothetical protein